MCEVSAHLHVVHTPSTCTYIAISSTQQINRWPCDTIYQDWHQVRFHFLRYFTNRGYTWLSTLSLTRQVAIAFSIPFQQNINYLCWSLTDGNFVPQKYESSIHGCTKGFFVNIVKFVAFHPPLFLHSSAKKFSLGPIPPEHLLIHTLAVKITSLLYSEV